MVSNRELDGVLDRFVDAVDREIDETITDEHVEQRLREVKAAVGSSPTTDPEG